MWTRTRATDRLAVDVPILQGPFGGGFSTVRLAAAVSNAGGLGGYGALTLTPEEIAQLVADLRQQTARPFNVNLWVPIPGQDDRAVTPAQIARAFARLRPHTEPFGLTELEPPPRFLPPFHDQLEALLSARPPVFSFIMGIPDPAILREAKRRGIVTIGTATTVDEAVAIADAGADLVVASGSDAGGHRGSFLRPADASLVGTMSLVPQVVSAVTIPVIAAGGIADGRGVAAALALGAEGVQIGTAFLASPEAGAPDVHRRMLGGPSSRWTRLTRVFSGRDARAVENAFMSSFDEDPDALLPFPAQGWLTAPMRRAAADAGRADLLPLWAGQSAALARQMSAGDLLHTLVEETDRVLGMPMMQPRGAERPSGPGAPASPRAR
jgi:nitronate monooxygenase